jgi:hypothetical protein
MPIKPPPRPRQNQRGQRKLQIPAVLHPDGGVDQFMDARNDMPAHFQRKDRQGQHQSQQKIAAQCLRLNVAAVVCFILIGVGVKFMGGISRALDGGHKGVGIRRAAHIGALRRQIDAGPRHAGHGHQRPFGPRHTGCAGQALDLQNLVHDPHSRHELSFMARMWGFPSWEGQALFARHIPGMG